jgi:hypothetical protein
VVPDDRVRQAWSLVVQLERALGRSRDTHPGVMAAGESGVSFICTSGGPVRIDAGPPRTALGAHQHVVQLAPFTDGGQARS